MFQRYFDKCFAEEAVQVVRAGADQPAQVREVRGHGQPHLPQRWLRLLEPQDSLPGTRIAYP